MYIQIVVDSKTDYSKINLKDIFTGREKELDTLNTIWGFSMESGEHYVYTILNSPGVGKSTLVKKFGEIIEDEGKGLHFNYVCNKKFTTRMGLHRDLMEKFVKLIDDKQNIIHNYIDKYTKENRKEITKKRIENIISESIIMQDKKIGYEDIAGLIARISGIIPIFYSSDEIQEFENNKFTEDSYDNETNLHYYAGILKSFLSDKILLVITGTDYNILYELGGTIGSPLSGKVHSKIISPFNSSDITDYVDKLIELTDINTTTMEYLHSYLQVYSGGHARTVETIVKVFLDKIDRLDRIVSYDEFMEEFTDIILLNEIGDNTLGGTLRSNKRDKLIELQSRKYFNEVRIWVNRGIDSDLKLGMIPRLKYSDDLEAMREIIYTLMSIGIIVRNGSDDFYICSYFHYLTFLRTLTGEYEVFLREIIANRYFRLLVGDHSGFGYTFERVILAIMIINSNRMKKFPFQISNIINLSGKVDYTNLELTEGTLYHTPRAKNIDSIARIDGDIKIFQITTIENVTQSKVDRFWKEVSLIKKEIAEEVDAWFISLRPVNAEIPENMNVIQYRDLVQFMDENIFNSLVSIKAKL